MKKNCILLLGLYIFSSLRCMENDQKNPNLHVITVPGLNGNGTNHEYIEEILDATKNNIELIPASTPQLAPDLGQYFCQRHLNHFIKKHQGKNLVLYGASQGTATILNFLSHNNLNNIKAVILEAALASGNSAIKHTAEHILGYERIANLPNSYYWLPYFAVVGWVPSYFPFGQQPIKEVSQIAQNLPIIIIHSKKDRKLPYEDACALYYGLKNSGHKKTYLVTLEGDNHGHILKDDEKKPVVKKILAKHKLIKTEEALIHEDKDLEKYQPDYYEFKKLYDDLISKEINHEKIGNRIILIISGIVIYILIKACANIA